MFACQKNIDSLLPSFSNTQKIKHRTGQLFAPGATAEGLQASGFNVVSKGIAFTSQAQRTAKGPVPKQLEICHTETNIS